MTRSLIALHLVSLMALGPGCAAPAAPGKSQVVVLRYRELGPQAASWPLIGHEWYQWNSQGPDDPGASDDVRVVVYRGLSRAEAEARFPVVRGVQDYRHLSYDKAMDHCDRLLREDPGLFAQLSATKKRIIEELGKP